MDKRSLVTLVNAENVESIIQVCLLKHKIFNKRASDFSLRIEKFGCLIESPEEIQEDDILTLIPLEKSLDENLENNQLIKNLEENLVILEDKHQMEAEPNHESYYEFESRSRTTFSERSLSENFEDNVEMNQIEDEDEKIDEEILEEEEEEEEMSEENADECISIESIMTKEFTSRNELSNQLKIWASNSRFSLRFENGEKTTSEGYKISVMACNQEKCPFYLQFVSHGPNKPYQLQNYWNSHDHILSKKDTGRNVTEEIFHKIKSLMGNVLDSVKLTDLINKEFKTSFSVDTIRHQIRKIKNQEFGKPSNDAQELINLLTEDSIKRGYFYKSLIVQNQLQKVCFMTSKMIELANKYKDVIILDTTHRCNRFNMPLLDVIVVDNLGRSRTIFIALLDNQKNDSFIWALEQLKSQFKTDPALIFSDEDEALLSGSNIICLF